MWPARCIPTRASIRRTASPRWCAAINNALQRADQIAHSEGKNGTYWFAPIVADAEAGFGGPLNAFELMKAMIEAGAAAVHFEDQLSSAKKCGHLGGKVVVPTSEFVQKLIAARLAADVMGVPTLLIARTDADSAGLLLSDIDPRDHPFLTGGRTAEGFFHFRGRHRCRHRARPGLRALCRYALVRDLRARTSRRRGASRKRSMPGTPGSCWPTTARLPSTGEKKLDDATIASFQQELAEMGYKFQFVTLAGFHALNLSMFELAKEYAASG